MAGVAAGRGQRSEAQPRGPVLVYATLTVTFVVLVAAVAFTARQPPPPAISEFAPEAQKQIVQAPLEQTSDIGSAKGGFGDAEVGPDGLPVGTTSTSTSTTSPAGPPIEANAVHRCYGTPPRQIEDTQSPPCVPYWVGDNGGATTRGVTRDQILVAANTNDNVSGQRVIADLERFFNRHFEFYGRQLKIMPFPPAPSDTSTNPDNCALKRAQADMVIAKGYFASLDAGGNPQTCYGMQIARNKMLFIEGPKGSGAGQFWSEDTMRSVAPYMWQYPVPWDVQFATIGRMVCAQLANRKAEFARDVRFRSQDRRIGLIMYTQPNPQQPYRSKPLEDALATCGSSLVAKRDYQDVAGRTEGNSFFADSVVAMNSANATTVICLCATLAQQNVAAAATNQAYFPEWLLGWDNDFNGNVAELWSPDGSQLEGVMGITFQPKQLPYAETTLNMALRAVDPGFQINHNANNAFHANQALYWNLLLLASGIQMAGPNLTPESFERGLQAARFPNPYSPQMEGVVGFGGGHSMTKDAALMWWSSTAPSMKPDDGNGTWCYVDGGRRFDLTSMPKEPKMFRGPCNPPPPPPPG